MAFGIRDLALKLSADARKRRSAWFSELFRIGPETRILDLGSENGDNIHRVLGANRYTPENVHIGDIDRQAIESGASNYGFTPVLLDESGLLPFADGYFDIVYCSSVIEHVTVPKSEVWTIRDGRRFAEVAVAAQTRFADEIRRVSKGYFVQTPAKAFPIESHSWLPFAGHLPRGLQVSLFGLTNRVWIKQTIPDFRLLGRREMAELFPDAEFKIERFAGFAKSLTAIRRN